jgi:hypothetical protein
MGSGGGRACDRLPIPLTVCPTCGAGFKHTRGWTWLDLDRIVDGVHENCTDDFPCPVCMDTGSMTRCGLLWIGAQFYPTVEGFMAEARKLGISRRLSAIPRDLKIGETWVLLAHPLAMLCESCNGTGWRSRGALPSVKCADCTQGRRAAIFHVFRPHSIEKLVTETQASDTEAMDALKARGITPVIVPSDDPDHQGSVWDADSEDEE